MVEGQRAEGEEEMSEGRQAAEEETEAGSAGRRRVGRLGQGRATGEEAEDGKSECSQRIPTMGFFP